MFYAVWKYTELYRKNIEAKETFCFQIRNYIMNDQSNAPLLLIGNAGSGKSAIMAKSANDALASAQGGELMGKK